MRTKIIAGNVIAVLAVGLVSYFVLSSQLKATFLQEVDSSIANDSQLFDRTWRLSGLEFADQVAEQASQRETADIFAASSESGQRERAHRRANQIADWFGRRNRDHAGPPDLVVVVDDRGLGIARNIDANRLNGTDLRPELTSLSGVLAGGPTATDVWQFTSGQQKLLQTAIAPVRAQDGAIVGALVVGYDISNGMAQRSGTLIGRDVAFLHDGAVYSSSLDGATVTSLRETLFGAQGDVTRATITSDPDGGQARAPSDWTSQLGSDEYRGITAALPLSASTDIAYVILGNRSAQAAKASSVITILMMTLVGVLIVIVYGFLIGGSILRPIEEMEEGILAVINGRTDLRLDIESAELGGLAYRVNQLLNVFTGTEEEDADGRVSSPPAAWAPPPEKLSDDDGDDEAALAAKLAAEPEKAYYSRVYAEYVVAKESAGEDVSNIPEDRFTQRLQANEKSLIKKHGCRMVRFSVEKRGTQVNLRPVIIP